MSDNPDTIPPGEKAPEGSDHNTRDDVEPPPKQESDSGFSLWKLFAEVLGLGCASTGLWVLGEHWDKQGLEFLGSLANFGSCASFFAAVAISVTKFTKRAKLVWVLLPDSGLRVAD